MEAFFDHLESHGSEDVNRMLKKLRETKVLDSQSISWCSAVATLILKEVGPKKIIEIGTGYGEHFNLLLPHVSSYVGVDAMYELVPDVYDVDGHDATKVNKKKLESFWKNAETFKDKVRLVVGNSFYVAHDPRYKKIFSDAELIIIDGCHHPAELVSMDYENFKKYLTTPHFIVWDDFLLSDLAPDIRRAILLSMQIMKKDGFAFLGAAVKNAYAMYIYKP